MFNIGFLCQKCGPIEKAKDKTIRKIKYRTCPVCETVVTPWTRPLKERIGRCGNCAGARFNLRIENSVMVRCCKDCGMEINPDTGEVIKRPNEIV